MTFFTLDGPWKYKVDETCSGETQGFFKSDYDKSDWGEASIPCNWYVGLNLDHNGIVWFRRKISVKSEWNGKLIRIFCKGIDYYAKIWVNGQEVGSHEGYFGHFSFNISKYLNFDDPGDNEIVVQVNAPFDEGYPMKKRQFKGGFLHWDCRPGNISKRGQERGSGGIWDSIFLKVTEKLHFKYVKIVSNDINDQDSEIKLKIAGFHSGRDGLKDVKLVVNVSPKNFDDMGQEFEFSINTLKSGRYFINQAFKLKKPKLWWTWDLGKPNLYSIKIALKQDGAILDEWNDTFGVRKIEYKADGWHLNDKKLFLRGANFFSSLWLSKMDDESYAVSVNQVREANLNFLRISYHLEKPNFYDIIDEAGIVLQQDFPTLWDYEYTEEALRAGIQQCKEMATQLHNHPSIILYSCFTEPFSKESHFMAETFKKVVEITDLLDRIVWPESSFFGHPFCGWYYLSKYSYLLCPGAPYPSEFGPQSLPNLNSPTWNDDNIDVKNHWPPDDHWEYHNCQTLLHYQVSGATPNLGLKGMIHLSQGYQGENLKFAIETFRRCKGKVHMLAFFMFKDAWPSVTWSIVDYFNLKKRSFEHVKEACSPVLCSFSLSETKKFPNPKIKLLGMVDLGLQIFGELRGLLWNEIVSPGKRKPIYLYVINDLIVPIEGNLILRGEYLGREFFKWTREITVQPSSNKLIVKLNLTVRPGIKPGRIKIFAEIFNKKDGTLVSSNYAKLYVNSRLKKWLFPFKRYAISIKKTAFSLIQVINQWT